MKKKLVICSPYLKSVGGTEIEAISYAIYLYDKKLFKRIIIFSDSKINIQPFEKLLGDRDIKVFTYPVFFSSSLVKIINRFFSKMGFSYNIIDYLYWKYKSITISNFLILTYTKSSYFFPILKSVFSSKKVIGKVTMGVFTILPNSYRNFYKKFSHLIVFNNKQKDFWIKTYGFKQMVSLDIMVTNESDLLKIPSKACVNDMNLVFGFLGRVASEKNILDMILLLDFLNNKKGFACKLIIQGEATDHVYKEQVYKKVEELELSSFVTFNNYFIDPSETYEFYEKIDVFLVTSLWEGGPITALEAVAAGRFVLGYDIGAMRERFGAFQYLINKDFTELCVSALAIINMTFNDKEMFLKKMREDYVLRLNNEMKLNTLMELFKDN
ncbi:glycosyltransferase [Thalassobellus citreus]|uniref:glycosyltransferase n=1 Tax=Thalassobellus citreus TaxID=3367752 RepID=UPI003790EC49